MTEHTVTEQQVLDALRTVQDPELHKDLVTLGMIQDIHIDDGAVAFRLVLTTPACPLRSQISNAAREAVEKVPGVQKVDVQVSANVQRHNRAIAEELIPCVRNSIAVASGKGGVGKSTVSTNLAVALAQSGALTGLLDADIFGPNIPQMMGITQEPRQSDSRIYPVENYGVKVISMGFFVPKDRPVIWRGPMVSQAIQQLLRDVEWGDLDYLIIDLPPGTGDAPLTLVQSIPLTGVVIVTTPQSVALADAMRGLAMFQRVGVPVLGIVENMSYYICPHCQERTEIFSYGGARREAERLGVPFLGEIPLDPQIRIAGDEGKPVVVSEPGSPQAEAFRLMAGKLASQVSMLGAAKSAT
ncbi:MAG: Mrp/NBP35 family ATP-binding protein [Chloroflexi bacterium]|nr:Mrp/NBP35 family ATP-binding protein [Chloroflexota bacterium]